MPPARIRVLTGVLRAVDRTRPRWRTRAWSGGRQATARFVASDDADQIRPAAQRGDVVRGVAAAAGHDLRGVVLEDQHRRLA